MLIVGTPQKWDPNKFTLPADIQGAEMALPGPRHAARAQFDALCASAGVAPVIRAEVDDMAMLRLIARDSSWLTLLPEVVVQDELKAGHLTAVSHIKNIQEHFYAITTQYRYRPPVLDLLMDMPGSQPSIASD
jgi:LysR family transcriptional activator of nhaA